MIAGEILQLPARKPDGLFPFIRKAKEGAGIKADEEHRKKGGRPGSKDPQGSQDQDKQKQEHHPVGQRGLQRGRRLIGKTH